MSKLISQRGVSLMEVLISLVVIAVGLLGMAGLQLRAQHAELEALQRSQALILLDDMVGRVQTNRRSSTARCYAITDATAGAPFAGAGSSAFSCTAYGTTSTQAAAVADLNQWDALLDGAGEMLGGAGGTAVGAMTGARGCITYDSGTDLYRVSVAWQGTTDTAVPDDTCAMGEYGDETKRRVVSRTFRIPDLD